MESKVNTIFQLDLKNKIFHNSNDFPRNSWSLDKGIINDISMTPLQLRVLLADMRKAKANMEALS